MEAYQIASENIVNWELFKPQTQQQIIKAILTFAKIELQEFYEKLFGVEYEERAD